MSGPEKKGSIDLADLGNWGQVERALHGDLKPLIAFLRSDEPINRLMRDYIADEIEREPEKRFRRRRHDDLDVRENDRALLFRVYSTKLEILLQKLGVDIDDDALFEAQDSISDRAALDYLSEIYGVEISDDDLKNALRRTQPGIFDPRGNQRRMRKLKKG